MMPADGDLSFKEQKGVSPDPELKTPIEMFYHWERETPDLVFLRQSRGDGTWLELTWSEVADRVRRLAAFLKSREFPDQSAIAIWSTNSVDWICADLAIMLCGHISVPLYAGQKADSVRHILEECEAEAIFLGPCGREFELNIALPKDLYRIAISGAGVPCFSDIEDIVQSFPRYEDCPAPRPDALMTIVYSSGTTGNPKGVMHAHATPAKVSAGMAETLGMARYDQTTPEGRTRLFSYLPLAHMAERGLIEFPALYSNAEVSVSAGLDHFSNEIQSVQPTFFLAVPRLWTKFKLALEGHLAGAKPKDLSPDMKRQLAHSLGMSEAKFIMTGSAPISTEIQTWFSELGIVLRESYGMTETFASGTTWPIGTEPQIGGVGFGNDVAQFRVDEAGEVWMRSSGMMLGYYKNPDLTEEVLKEGWYKSGDLGELDADGYLRITGRLGDVFKTAKGKFCHPDEVERKFHAIAELEQLVLIGRALEQPVIVANLAPDAKDKNGTLVEERLEIALDEINKTLASHERVAQILITQLEWTTDNGLLTPTLKQKRTLLDNHYRQAILNAEGAASVQWLDDLEHKSGGT